jgi:putative oxidoreductase
MRIIVVIAAIFLLIGLWTPVIGAALAVTELWFFFSQGGRAAIFLLLALLAASLAMIGPGAWSIDARLFGRKHLKNAPRQSSAAPIN